MSLDVTTVRKFVRRASCTSPTRSGSITTYRSSSLEAFVERCRIPTGNARDPPSPPALRRSLIRRQRSGKVGYSPVVPKAISVRRLPCHAFRQAKKIHVPSFFRQALLPPSGSRASLKFASPNHPMWRALRRWRVGSGRSTRWLSRVIPVTQAETHREERRSISEVRYGGMPDLWHNHYILEHLFMAQGESSGSSPTARHARSRRVLAR